MFVDGDVLVASSYMLFMYLYFSILYADEYNLQNIITNYFYCRLFRSGTSGPHPERGEGTGVTWGFRGGPGGVPTGAGSSAGHDPGRPDRLGHRRRTPLLVYRAAGDSGGLAGGQGEQTPRCGDAGQLQHYLEN